MTENTHSSILRRMTGQRATGADENPLTSSRALRLALTKAANDTVGLVLTVTSIEENVQPLDEMLAALNDSLMLIELHRDSALVGVAAFDMQLRAAILEMQTVGSLIGAPADERAATGTDKQMCEPVLENFLQALPQALHGTEFEGWLDGIGIGSQFASTRAAGLVLNDQGYRTLRLSVDLGVSDRTGMILLSVPPVPHPTHGPAQPEEDVDWGTQFQTAVSDAPASLEAILHRFHIPLAQARNLAVGQMIPLPGCTVSSIRLITADGDKVAEAKLGQVGGKRAVRIESAPMPRMGELSGATMAPTEEVGLPDTLAIDAGGLMDAPIDFEVQTEDAEPFMGGADAAPDEGFPMMDMDSVSLGEDT